MNPHDDKPTQDPTYSDEVYYIRGVGADGLKFEAVGKEAFDFFIESMRSKADPHDDTNPINGFYKHIPGAEELSQEWMKEGMDDTTEPMTVDLKRIVEIRLDILEEQIKSNTLPPRHIIVDQFVAAINALIEQRERAARVDELLIFNRAVADRKPKETWEDWCWRVVHYLQDRIAKLKEEKT